MKLEIIKVIKTETVEGTGTEKDPVRTVVRYWDENGIVIAEKEKITACQLRLRLFHKQDPNQRKL